MSNLLVELTTRIVSSHASTVELTSEELIQEIQKVYTTLKQLDTEPSVPEAVVSSEKEVPAPAPKKSIQKDQIICLICNKGGFKTLARHLKQAHNMKPAEYRKQFGLPAGTVLAAKSYSDARRQAAIKNNLGEKLTAGRIKYQSEKSAKKAAPKNM